MFFEKFKTQSPAVHPTIKWIDFLLKYLPICQFNTWMKTIYIIFIVTFSPIGLRLNATVFTRSHAASSVKCVLQCLNEPCCRSVNYHKTPTCDYSKENCELLHVISTENPQYLVEDKEFDYYILLPQPNRVS